MILLIYFWIFLASSASVSDNPASQGDIRMRLLSRDLMNRISAAVAAARSSSPINVVEIAQAVQSETPQENAAFEDILSYVLDVAQCTGEPLLFERQHGIAEGACMNGLIDS